MVWIKNKKIKCDDLISKTFFQLSISGSPVSALFSQVCDVMKASSIWISSSSLFLSYNATLFVFFLVAFHLTYSVQHNRCLPRRKTESVNYSGLNLVWKHSGHRIKALYSVTWRLCNRERTPAVPSEQVLGDCGEEDVIKSLLECILTFQLKSPAKKK